MRTSLITGLLSVIVLVIGASPVSACSQPEEDIRDIVWVREGEPLPARLVEILEHPGSFAVERVMEQHTAAAWFHHVAGAFVVRQAWGPAPAAFAPERDGSQRRLGGDCAFSHDAAALGRSELVLHTEDDVVFLEGHQPAALLDDHYGPSRPVPIDEQALALMMDDLERPALFRLGAWGQQHVLAIAFVGLGISLFALRFRRRTRPTVV